MMQQVATQRSDIAALPVDIEPTDAGSSASQKQAFAEIFDQTSKAEASSVQKSREKNADDITDAKSVKRPPPADHQDSREIRGRGDKKPADELVRSREQVAEKQTKSAESDTAEASATATETVVDDAAEGNTTEVIEGELAEQSAQAGETIESEIQPDWLAFVDAIRSLNTEAQAETASESSDVIIDADTTVVDSELETDVLIPSAKDEVAVAPEIDLEALIARLKGDLPPAENGQSAQGDKADMAALAEALNEAINKLMVNEEEVEPGTVDEAANEEVMKIAASLLAALTKSNGKGDNRITENQTELDGQGDAELAADSELLVALIRAEMSDDGHNSADSGQGRNNGAETEQTAVELPVKQETDLMALLSHTEAETQTVVAENLADKVVAMLPENASDSQKAEVRQGVIDSVKQYQAKLDTGTAPESALETMIADVIGSADIVPEENIEQRIASELHQLSMLVSTATQVANTGNPSVMVSSVSQADNTVADIQQLRAERAAQNSQNADRPVNIHQAEGQAQLAEKVRWMVNARNPMAEIRLDPPELGSMQVRVNVSGDTASVNFVVQSPQARDALAQAEPRLREMLAEQGISLGESVVSQQQQGEGNEPGEGGSGRGGNGQFAGGGEEETSVIEQSLTRQAQGGIDDYA